MTPAERDELERLELEHARRRQQARPVVFVALIVGILFLGWFFKQYLPVLGDILRAAGWI